MSFLVASDSQQSQERLALVLSVTHDAVWDWQLMNGEMYVSPEWYEHIGYTASEIVPGVETWRSLLHPEDAAKAIESWRRHLDGETAAYDSEYRLHHKMGHWVWIHSRARVMERDTAGRAVRIIGLNRNTSARREALQQREAQRRRVQQHEANSLMAGRVAHDFNNLLMVISASAEFLAQGTATTDTRREDIMAIRTAADKAAELTRQLMVVSHQHVLEPTAFPVNDAVRKMLPLLEGIVSGSGVVRCIMSLDPDVGDIHADAGHIEQVLMNLVMNSRDAMPDGGVLMVSTRRVARMDDDGEPGGHWIQIVIEDTGVGMSEEVLARACEPFFTTKDKELGTGLGLATAYGIVQQSGGEIIMHSTIGVGTRVEIRFPELEMALSAGSR